MVVFGPSPLLAVSIEPRPDGSSDDVRLLPGGQGIWVAQAAAAMGADAVVCGMSGGVIGSLLESLLDAVPVTRSFVRTEQASGCYVVDRRGPDNEMVASAWAPAPSPAQVADLVELTCSAARAGDVLAVCNPMPGETLPLDVYPQLVARVRDAGVHVIVDLSSPRLDAALEGEPDVVKVNDWELAQYVVGPVDAPGERRAAIERLIGHGAQSVVESRGNRSVFAVRSDGERFEITPPHVDAGSEAGCGDAMTGAMAAALAQGKPWLEALTLGVAAGAANYACGHLDSGAKRVIEDMLAQVQVRATE